MTDEKTFLKWLIKNHYSEGDFLTVLEKALDIRP